jgi:hypothetical protein
MVELQANVESMVSCFIMLEFVASQVSRRLQPMDMIVNFSPFKLEMDQNTWRYSRSI